ITAMTGTRAVRLNVSSSLNRMSDAVTVPPGLLIRITSARIPESSEAFLSSSRNRTSSGTRGVVPPTTTMGAGPSSLRNPVTTVARLTIDDVRAAAQRLSGHIYRTPVISSAAADEASDYRVFFKCENLQIAGSFKIRGALNKLRSLAPAERARGVVAYSSG